METLEWLFKACAAAGGLGLVLQLVMLLFGGDVDHDAAPADHMDGAFGLLSVRAVSGFVAFFGLAGWYSVSRGWSPLVSTLLALGSGAVAMALASSLVLLQRKLQAEGNIDPQNAVGETARVYLRIPPRRTGAGRITMKLQGRSVEFLAMSDGEEFPTGTPVVVRALISSDTCLVAPIAASADTSVEESHR
ncbi:MAG: hypothetical protein HC882_10040 [Acidobacteria bacterium]|nr:hypothetical protein [Acidobacteriota bacterium]